MSSSVDINDERLRQRHIKDLSDQTSSNEFPMHSLDMADGEPGSRWSDLGSDKKNVLVLIFLYVLQGIPLGLAGSMPMILQARKVDYATQAFFSFAFWPFSIKLLWAPVVDSLYLSRFGRRKSWLVPVQYLIGIFMFFLSYRIQSLIGSDSTDSSSGGEIDAVALTGTFVCLCFLAATQDIAVDGWALTMLKKENVGWASTCNAMGQTAGYFLGNVVFLALESPEFCNNYLRSTPQPTGLVTIQGFMYFWAWVFVATTTLTALFKSEEKESNDERPEGVLDTYKTLWRIIRLPSVQKYCVLLLTAKVAFAATDAVAGLKLIENGMPKERLALLGVPMIPIQILLPLFISKYTAGNDPLNVFMGAYPFRLIAGVIIAYVVSITKFDTANPDIPITFYFILFAVYAFHQMALYSMFVSQMAFTAKISDPTVGGTYMTLLNTISNLGGNWPATVALYMVSHLDIKSEGVKTLDGFYIETTICSLIGFIWYILYRSRVRAKRIPQFPNVAREDQVTLLRSGWNELLILSFSHRSAGAKDSLVLSPRLHIDRNSAHQAGVGMIFDRVLTELVSKMREMNVDKTELACLVAIILFNPDVKNLGQSLDVEKYRENVYGTLEEYCRTTYPEEPGRFGKLLLRLPALRSIGLKCVEHLFFFKLIGNTPIENFLNEMLETSLIQMSN